MLAGKKEGVKAGYSRSSERMETQQKEARTPERKLLASCPLRLLSHNPFRLLSHNPVGLLLNCPYRNSITEL